MKEVKLTLNEVGEALEAAAIKKAGYAGSKCSVRTNITRIVVLVNPGDKYIYYTVERTKDLN